MASGFCFSWSALQFIVLFLLVKVNSNAGQVDNVPGGVCDDGKFGIAEDLEDFQCLGGHISISTYDFPAGHSQCANQTEAAEHVCMSSQITYNAEPPSSGAHRNLWPKYGEYDYVPPQRWVHSLEHGAVVFLYHPCAPADQVTALKRLARSCLWRHVITAYPHLTQQQPLAMVTWGCVYRMSWVDVGSAEQWIMENALHSPEAAVYQDGTYTHGLKEAADIVSTVWDNQLCPQYQVPSLGAVSTPASTEAVKIKTDPSSHTTLTTEGEDPISDAPVTTEEEPTIDHSVQVLTTSVILFPTSTNIPVNTHDPFTDDNSTNSATNPILPNEHNNQTIGQSNLGNSGTSIVGLVFLTGLLALLFVAVLLFVLFKLRPPRKKYGRYKNVLPFSLQTESGIAIPTIGIPKGTKAEAEVLLPYDDEDEI